MSKSYAGIINESDDNSYDNLSQKNKNNNFVFGKSINTKFQSFNNFNLYSHQNENANKEKANVLIFHNI